MLNDREHWDAFYNEWRMSIPSQFCVMTALDIDPSDQVVEFGCGNGRDALFFSRCGARVLALDASAAAISNAEAMGEQVPDGNLVFACCDVGDKRRLGDIVNDWLKDDMRTIFYARFFLHSIDDSRQGTLLSFIRETMDSQDRLYLEFRTALDADKPKEFGQHYRRYLDFKAFTDSLEAMGFQIEYSVEGRGMAVFRGEDAFVGRIVATLAA